MPEARTGKSIDAALASGRAGATIIGEAVPIFARWPVFSGRVNVILSGLTLGLPLILHEISLLNFPESR